MRRFLIITTFLLALVMLIKTEPQTQAFPQESTKTLYVWGIDDLSDEVSQAALRFQREYPDTSVEYKRFRDRQEYYEVLLHELERQKGPDLILFSESNRGDLSHFLVPFAAQNTSQFPAMVEEELLQDGQVLGLPITTESLVMFYNAEHFGENYPQTWDDIAVRSENFKIGGVAIGELSSIRSGWSIIKAMLLQKDIDPSGKNRDGLTEILDYFARFADPVDPYFNWSENLNKDYELDEIESFVRGKVASIVGDRETYELILQKMNQFEGIVPNIVTTETLRVAPLPQFDPANPKTLATYTAYGVSQHSTDPDQAWELLKALTSQEVAEMLIQSGSIPARSIDSSELSDPLLKVMIQQVPHGKRYNLDQRIADEISQMLP